MTSSPRVVMPTDFANLTTMTTATSVNLDVELVALGAENEPRPLDEWLTTFPLTAVVLDPYTAESARILRTAHRVLMNYRGADCRTCWVLACDSDGARRFLGPWAEELLTFIDPDRRLVRALGLECLPAFMLVRQDGSVTASAQGWDPQQWRAVAETVSATTVWNRPLIGGDGDPAAYPGTPV